MQIKTTMEFHYSPIRMSKIEKTEHVKCYKGIGTLKNIHLEKAIW